MIESLVAETDWIKFIEGLPPWNAPSNSVLVVAPHPDDETLGTGGFIAAQRARGVDVIVAAVTDGEHAYPGNSALEVEALGHLRRREQEQALARLGVGKDSIVSFGLPDSAVQSQYEQLVEHLSSLTSEHTHIVAPWRGDFHPDHQACGAAAEQVARLTGARLSSYFFWTWHLGSVDLLSPLSLRSFPLTAVFLQAKRDALACHHSQLVRPSGEPILPEALLAPARRACEIFVVSR